MENKDNYYGLMDDANTDYGYVDDLMQGEPLDICDEILDHNFNEPKTWSNVGNPENVKEKEVDFELTPPIENTGDKIADNYEIINAAKSMGSAIKNDCNKITRQVKQVYNKHNKEKYEDSVESTYSKYGSIENRDVTLIDWILYTLQLIVPVYNIFYTYRISHGMDTKPSMHEMGKLGFIEAILLNFSLICMIINKLV